MDDRRAGALAVLLALAVCALAWLAADGVPTCVERVPAGIMCTSTHRSEAPR